MLLIAAIIAGLILILRDGIPWTRAIASGVIHTRGTRRQKVERAAEPDRFKALADQRLRGTVPGLICLAAAIGWIAWSFLSAVLQTMQTEAGL
jgi:hypothetical protein